MVQDQPETQVRSERLTVAVTPAEKKAAEFVALALDAGGVSGLLRRMSLVDVMAEYGRMMLAIRTGEAA